MFKLALMFAVLTMVFAFGILGTDKGSNAHDISAIFFIVSLVLMLICSVAGLIRR